MLKLFLRFYLLMLVLVVLFLVSSIQFMVIFPFPRDLWMNGQAVGEITPIFSYLQAQFAEVPESEWNQVLQRLTPSMPHKPITIEPINQIVLPDNHQRALLLEGKIVAAVSFFHAPFNDTTDSYAATAYQRIPHSDLALALQVQQKQRDNELGTQMWIIHFVSLELAKNPHNPTDVVLKNFGQQYHTPVQLVPLKTLTPEIQNYLTQHQFLMDSSNNFNTFLQAYYLYTPDTVMLIGPFQYPWYINQFGTLFMGTMIVLISFFMLLSLYFFYRDLKKLDRLAQAYGEGQFNYSVRIGRFASMSRLYQNLRTMGLRIQTLLSSHKELTQAVSHELKTPLSRLRFALTMAEEAKTKSEIYANLAHIHDAADDLEKLVGELLIYARFDRQFFNLESSPLNLIEALSPILAEASERQADKHLSTEIPAGLEGIKINMAPQYFKKLIENLLSNAFRYAKSEIKVSVQGDDKQVYIEVADDGPGIPEADRERIFEPFVSLDESRNKELSGHGLGLAIVARIVAAHQGQVFVKPADLGGANFVLVFPRLAS